MLTIDTPTHILTSSPVKNRVDKEIVNLPTVPKVSTKAASIETSVGTSKSASVGVSIGKSVGSSVGKSIGASVGISTDSFPSKKSTVTGMSTQTDTKMLLSTTKRTSRGQSRDSHLELEKRNRKDIKKREEFEQKMKLIAKEIGSINMTGGREDNSNRFTDAMTRVTDLLKVNQLLRDDNNAKDDSLRK